MKRIIAVGLMIASESALHAQAVNVRGRISNGAGQPVADAIVELVREGVKDTTASDGSYSLIKPSISNRPLPAPLTESMSLQNGILVFTVEKPSPMKVEVFDANGNTLKKEVWAEAQPGVYRLNIAPSRPSNGILIVQSSIGPHVRTFRYLPWQKADSEGNITMAGAGPAGWTQAKMAAPVDTLKVTARGFATKKVVLASYDTTVNVILEAGPIAKPLEEAQRAYVDLRFGMFIHFGILTYTGSWAQGNLPINMFNPTKLDVGQWADAAVKAKMKFGILTAKHHDGFALWPTSVGNFSVKNISWRGGQGDVVREYVDAFRAKGLKPCLYYSIFDATEGIADAPTITRAKIEFVKTQIRELLTNYGEIPVLFIDGWAWKMGHQAIAYQEIHELVKSLQPNCLLADNTHLSSPWNVDIVHFEEPKGVFAPAGNTYPAHQGQKINSIGGNDWFWSPNIGGLMSLSSIVDGHLERLEPLWTNFVLNCPPNRDGLLDDAIVNRLAEVGAAWAPNPARPPLPAQGPQIERPYTPVAAAATSGTAANAIDGINDTGRNTHWETSGAFPQSITVDLGQGRPDVGMVSVTPRYSNSRPVTSGNITSYRVLLSTDNSTFTEAAAGTWEADAKMKIATFAPAAARYVRLEVRAANGVSAVAVEIMVGGR